MQLEIVLVQTDIKDGIPQFAMAKPPIAPIIITIICRSILVIACLSPLARLI